jgi:hypothetical protein
MSVTNNWRFCPVITLPRLAVRIRIPRRQRKSARYLTGLGIVDLERLGANRFQALDQRGFQFLPLSWQKEFIWGQSGSHAGLAHLKPLWLQNDVQRPIPGHTFKRKVTEPRLCPRGVTTLNERSHVNSGEQRTNFDVLKVADNLFTNRMPWV